MLSLIRQIVGRPWAIQAEVAHHVRGLVAREGIGVLRELAGLKALVHDPTAAARHAGLGVTATWHLHAGGDQWGYVAAGQAPQGRANGGFIARIPVIGVMTQRVEEINSAYTRSSAEVAEEVLAAAAEPRVDAVVLEFDSPGGEVFGVPELWADIKRAAKIKPVVAAVNAVCASAALYAASAADEIVVTPSGQIGSLGVYAMHVDESAALAAEGVKLTFVVAGDAPFKVEGNSTEPLGDDARAELQRHVDAYMGAFVRDVAKGRDLTAKQVVDRFGKGRMLTPAEAVAAGMADRVGTLRDAFGQAAELARERSGGAKPRAMSVAQAQAALRGEAQ